MKPQINGNRDPSSVAVSCSKNQGGLRGGARFRPSVRPEAKTRILRQEPSRVGRQLDGGEEKQQTHGGLLGTKLKD